MESRIEELQSAMHRVLIDAEYAIRQLRNHDCTERALDALERIAECAAECRGAPDQYIYTESPKEWTQADMGGEG